MKKYKCAKIYFICLSVFIFIFSSNVYAAKPGFFYFINIFYNKDSDLIKLHEKDKTWGMPIYIKERCMINFSDIKNSRYFAKVISNKNEILTDNYNIGNLETVLMADGPKGGQVEFLKKGVVTICVPYFENGHMVEIFDRSINQKVLTIDVSEFAAKPTPPIYITTSPLPTATSTFPAGYSVKNFLLAAVLAVMGGAVIYAIYRKLKKKNNKDQNL